MPPAAAVGVALAAAAIGTGISVFGQVQQAKATKAAAEFNARVAENEAVNVENERAESVRRKRIENRRALAKQRAGAARAGVLFEGSPLDIAAETAGELELRVLDENRAALAERTRLTAQAGITRFEGRQRPKAAKIGAVGTGIAGIARGAQIAI